MTEKHNPPQKENNFEKYISELFFAGFNAFTLKEIKEIERLTLGLFFNDGKLDSPARIQEKHRAEIINTALSFYGDEHFSVIKDRLMDTEPVYICELLHSEGSIEQYLLRAKGRTFESKTRFSAIAGQVFASMASKIDTFNGDLTKVANDSVFTFDMCLTLLNMKKESLKSPMMQNLFIKRVKKYAKIYDKCHFHLDSEKDAICKQLDIYVKLYKNRLYEHFLKSTGSEDAAYAKMSNFISNSHKRIYNDPLVKYLCDKQLPRESARDCVKKEMLIAHDCVALHLQNPYKMGSYIIFGPNPSDDTVLHEAQHALDSVAFESGLNGRRKRKPSIYMPKQDYRHNQPFNEAIASFLAKKMTEHRKKHFKKHIISGSANVTGYSVIVTPMLNFLNAYLDDLKEVVFTTDPVESLKKIIGRVEYEELARLCSDTLTHYMHGNSQMYKIKCEELKSLSDSLASRKKTTTQKKNTLRNLIKNRHSNDLEM